jgi:uncharacterized damage-inducible protein DinB
MEWFFMSEQTSSLATIFNGWDEYQQHLVDALAPLTPEQLALHASSDLRSIGEIATHIIGCRVRWFHDLMGEGSEEIAPIARWDRRGEPVRDAEGLVHGLQVSWNMIANALARWTIADLDYVFHETYHGEEYHLSRQWVVWHVIEHDLHHGGELSYSLGMHGLAGIDI